MQTYVSLGYKANIFQNEKRQVCIQLLCAKILRSRCLTFKISQQNKFLTIKICGILMLHAEKIWSLDYSLERNNKFRPYFLIFCTILCRCLKLEKNESLHKTDRFIAGNHRRNIYSAGFYVDIYSCFYFSRGAILWKELNNTRRLSRQNFNDW